MDQETNYQPVQLVTIKPLDSTRETFGLALLCSFILLLMAGRYYSLHSAQQILLRPYQKPDTVLTRQQRTLYRTLHTSVWEIIELRNQQGWWPETGLLEEREIPPYDRRFLPVSLNDYSWISYDGGSWIDYLGISRNREFSVILRLIDLHAGYHPHPHPGIDYDPELSVAAQVWFYPDSARPYPGERLPEAGWFWLIKKDNPLLFGPSGLTKNPAAMQNSE